MDSLDAAGPALLLGIAAGAGFFIAIVAVFWMSRAIATPAASLRHHPIEGRLARVVVGVPAAGVGRIAFAAAGKRCGMAARSDEHHAIEAGADVVVLEVRRGVATVTALGELHVERNRS